MRLVNYLLLILLFPSCETREINIKAEDAEFTTDFHTNNLTIHRDALNLITLEIVGNHYNVYTLSYTTGGNALVYDRDRNLVSRSMEVETMDEFYFEPLVVGSCHVIFEVKNNVGNSDVGEFTFNVLE